MHIRHAQVNPGAPVAKYKRGSKTTGICPLAAWGQKAEVKVSWGCFLLRDTMFQAPFHCWCCLASWAPGLADVPLPSLPPSLCGFSLDVSLNRLGVLIL